ncbi:hypothetical protein JK636_21190 [Clostridium sp. YIM B02515]|uniref:Uncharacterized protein n=1 Tax=Clostridium rhizosphaerae TaxID=2803861 RepID=A0ABS1TG08_9CLOT|nr:hypothetical protein [Clostridium rhizosphaerae]MBL4938230.1 hypothetical protein [Clostridium rhizosphaerae]
MIIISNNCRDPNFNLALEEYVVKYMNPKEDYVIQCKMNLCSAMTYIGHGDLRFSIIICCHSNSYSMKKLRGYRLNPCKIK